MRTGREVIKTGKGGMPSPFDTIGKSFRLIFFSEKALLTLMLDRRHTFNVFFMYAVSLVIPYKGLDGIVHPENFGHIVESVMLTAIYIGLLYLYLPKTKGVFFAAVRVILSFESTAVLLPLTFFMTDQQLRYFHPIFLAWYLSLSVFAVSKMKGYGYILSTVVVFGAFVATVIFPAFFMG